MNVILLIFSLVASACGSEHDYKDKKIDSEFKDLIELFEKEQDVKVDVDVIFNSLNPPTVGMCYFFRDTTTQDKTGVRIEIDPEFWFDSSKITKEELLFHELGHCILDRDHDTTVLYGTIPKSVMYPYVFTTSYSLFREYYVNELKNPETQLTDYQ